MPSLRELEEIGSGEIGVSLDRMPQTQGGANNLMITRRYKVRSDIATTYLFQILDPNVRITDLTFPNAYLVSQAIGGKDKADGVLTCVFCQIPTRWDEAYPNPVPFPGVLPSSLMTPFDFKFRSSAQSLYSTAFVRHEYFLGPLQNVPVLPLFQPIDQFGNKTSVLDDWSAPSSDEYVAMTSARREIVISSVVHPFRGDIYETKSLIAVAA